MNLIQWGRLILTKVKNNQFRSISIFMNISLICTCLYLYNQIQDTHNVVMQKTDELGPGHKMVQVRPHVGLKRGEEKGLIDFQEGGIGCITEGERLCVA